MNSGLTSIDPLHTMVCDKALRLFVAKEVDRLCFVATPITRVVRVSYALRSLPVVVKERARAS